MDRFVGFPRRLPRSFPLPCLGSAGNKMATNSNAINFYLRCAVFCLQRSDLKQFVKTNIKINIETYIFALSSPYAARVTATAAARRLFAYLFTFVIMRRRALI